MAIPDYQTLMLPLLSLLKDGKERSTTETYDILAKKFKITDEERKISLEDGTPLFNNRVAWAKTYLKHAGLVHYPRRAYCQITEEGLLVIHQSPNRIDYHYLKQYKSFKEFIKGKKETDQKSEKIEKQSTPRDKLESGYKEINRQLRIELIEKVKQSPPEFFEKLVVDLLLSMGYGGSRKEAGQVTQYANDEGIDGIINEDRLGLDMIYIQAKRWTKYNIDRTEIQKFVGALQGKRAKKGVFITTTSFSEGAKQYANSIENRVVLIDGERLTELMIEHNVGVSTAQVYTLKKIDTDYFEDSEV